MTSRIIAGVVLASAVALGAQPAGRAPRNAAEFDALFQQVKNWGRWGPDDQLGSINLITPATRKQAIALAKTGESVSLAHTLLTEKADDNASPFEHTMNRGFSTDTLKISYHGYAHSHMDALCHYGYKDQLFNFTATARMSCDSTETASQTLQLENLASAAICYAGLR